MTLIVGLYGGPGCGKSTLAAGVYHELKQLNKNVELVREYVKAWAYRGDKINKYDELYIFAKQLREESNVYGKVDVIVTDRPLFMSSVYDKFYGGSGLLCATAQRVREIQILEGLKHLDLFVKRNKPYQNVGRFENEIQANEIDDLTLKTVKGLINVSAVNDVLVEIEKILSPIQPMLTYKLDKNLKDWCLCSDGYTRKITVAKALGFIEVKD